MCLPERDKKQTGEFERGYHPTQVLALYAPFVGDVYSGSQEVLRRTTFMISI